MPRYIFLRFIHKKRNLLKIVASLLLVEKPVGPRNALRGVLCFSAACSIRTATMRLLLKDGGHLYSKVLHLYISKYDTNTKSVLPSNISGAILH